LQYRHPIYFSNYHMVNLYFAHLVMSCLIAFLCTLMIEAPFMQLLKFILPTGRKSESRGGNNPANNNNKESETRGETRCSVSPAPSDRSQDSGPSGYGSTSNILARSQDKVIVQI